MDSMPPRSHNQTTHIFNSLWRATGTTGRTYYSSRRSARIAVDRKTASCHECVISLHGGP